jgi:Xaa-Pro aminopeptidase
MGMDFEERVDYRRLHRYRFSHVKQALENSDLGALLVFDVNKILTPARGNASGSA